MIIHTKKIIKNIGIKFLEEGKEIINVVKGEEKIKFILFKGKMTTNKIYKKTNLKPRTVRQCLLKLEKKGKVKRIKGKEINKKVRYCDSWILKKEESMVKKVPENKVFAYYKTEHQNKGYRQHYMFFPKKIILNEDFISAIGFFEAEGSKTKHKSIEAVNSEPKLIKSFLKLLEIFGIAKENLTYRITFNKKIPRLIKKSKIIIEKEAEKVWRKEVQIPKNKKIKFSHLGKAEGKPKGEIIKYGSLTLNYNSVLFRSFLFELIKECKKNIQTQKEAIAYLRGYLAGEAYVGKKDYQIQIASNDENELDFLKKLLEKIEVKNSFSKKTSTCPKRLLISHLKSHIILEKKDIFLFHSSKEKALIIKILNYKNVKEEKRKELEKKLKQINQKPVFY